MSGSPGRSRPHRSLPLSRFNALSRQTTAWPRAATRWARGVNGKGILQVGGGNGATTGGGLATSTGLNITGHGIAANTAFIPWAFSVGLYTTTFNGTATGDASTARFLATDASGALLAFGSMTVLKVSRKKKA